MAADVDIAGIPMQVMRGCLVVSIQIDLDDAVLERFKNELLEKVRATQVGGVIFDISGLDLLDAHEFFGLRACMAMSQLMGARAILVGVNVGIASSLVDLDVDVANLTATRTLERALDLLAAEDAPEHAV